MAVTLWCACRSAAALPIRPKKKRQLQRRRAARTPTPCVCRIHRDHYKDPPSTHLGVVHATRRAHKRLLGIGAGTSRGRGLGSHAPAMRWRTDTGRHSRLAHSMRCSMCCSTDAAEVTARGHGSCQGRAPTTTGKANQHFLGEGSVLKIAQESAAAFDSCRERRLGIYRHDQQTCHCMHTLRVELKGSLRANLNQLLSRLQLKFGLSKHRRRLW